MSTYRCSLIKGGWVLGILAGFSGITLAAEPIALESITNKVRTQNLSIQSAREKWEAMKQRAPQVSAWDDLMFGVDVERMGTTRLFTFTDNEWMVSQTLPVWGKNRSKGRAAVAEAEGAFEELRRAELDALGRARNSYYKLAAAYGRLEINQANQELLKQLNESTRAGYEAGGVSQADLLMAQTELAKIEETRREIEADITEQESQLNVLMNQPAQTRLGQPAALVFKPVGITAEIARQQALANRPEIRIAEKKRAAETARLQLAHREWLPDPQFRVEARQFKDSSGFIQEYDTGVFFSIPWINHKKYSAGVLEAKRNLRGAELEEEAARNEALGMVREKFARIDQYAKSYLLYRDQIIPQSDQAVKALRAEYESGKSGFSPLLTARRSYQETQNSALQHLMNYRVALTEMETLIGGRGTRPTPRSPKSAGSKIQL